MANKGTPMIIPVNPNIPLNKRIANSTQKLEIPIEPPTIFGPIIFPSTCCRMIIITTKTIHLIGSSIKIRNPAGIAPIKGPKKGIILVTPIKTAIKSGNGNCKITIRI